MHKNSYRSGEDIFKRIRLNDVHAKTDWTYELANNITDVQPLQDTMRIKGQEAQEIVKYLYSLEWHIQMVHTGNPISVQTSLEGVINAAMLMANACLKYSSLEKMTGFFMSLTNHMISCCKRYLSQVTRSM